MGKTVKVEAAKVFTKYVPGHGIVHGDPKGKSDAQKPVVPVHAVAGLISDGAVKKPKGWKPPEPKKGDEAENPNARADEKSEVEALKAELAAANEKAANAETALESEKQRADDAESLLADATKPDEGGEKGEEKAP